MKRRTLDILFSIGGALMALALLVLSLVLFNQARFAHNYVHDQLAQQKIVFTAADKLADDEKQASCLVANGGKQLVSGKQAECYANGSSRAEAGESPHNYGCATDWALFVDEKFIWP